MKLTVSRNAFGIFGSLICLGLFLCLCMPLYILGALWWVKGLFAVVLGLVIDSLRRKVRILNFLYGGIDLDEMRVGPILFTILPPPWYTTRRSVIVCCIFIVWLSLIITPIVLRSDGIVVISALVFAVFSSVLIVDVIEKRWLVQGKGKA